ncbi:MAG TPA: alpha/beta fold hydrolase [Casimicrobiaceae bacterium]|nr:alpha/beta fold hydrolase [Casimicrobiaceae bacterium]
MRDGGAHEPFAPFRGPRWLPGGHAQTIYPYFLKRPRVAYRRERVTTHDGDFWDFDWLADQNEATPEAPLVVLFHGLEGGAQSHYALLLMRDVAARGWRGVVPHFRGCGGEPNLLPRAYHSGDYEEVGAMLAQLRPRFPAATPFFAVGVSLGGSALLNWLGRAGHEARSFLCAAATVSVPLDLMAAGIAIDQGLNRIYTHHFLATLKPKALGMARRFPGRLDASRIAHVRTMWDFDEVVTAPLHGFAGANDYWTRASCKPWLSKIEVPTLVLNARNDPFVPGRSLPTGADVAPAVTLEQPAHGGHCGFMTGPAPGRIDWLPRRLLRFFDEAKALAAASS